MRQEVTIAGEPVWMEAMTGRVLGEKKWAETHVHGSGGGGSVYAGTGYVSPIRVTSTHTTRHEFWVQGANGQEICVALADSAARVRENQMVSVAWAARQGQARGPFLLLHNGASRERAWLEPDQLLLGRMGLRDPLSSARRKLLIFVVFLGVLLLGSPETGYAVCAIVGGLLLLWVLGRRKHAATAEAKMACSQLMDQEAGGAALSAPVTR